ncbi:DKNYY family protein [Prevotella aff. ruminicola Tc2-24]|uniref:DKNYY family protein n=2 Tax=Prevotella aff. ruminicola Tc2-24 TaxID=81582 RepID=A0A1I0N9Z1_9BACT|nr:DKNYY domain-containing protein [Prevotella sp. lc2012]SEV98085.1 DKNYY family protein [Prevotella aff. ruminicola Tc2-24]
MKQVNFLFRICLVMAMMGWTLTSYAQRYEVDRDRVYFGGEMVIHADIRSFVDLGFGYAKDRHHVYMNGRILEYVDPSSFRLKESRHRHGHANTDRDIQEPYKGYHKTSFSVYYGDKKIDAVSSQFVELDYGYAKDSFSVFFLGEKIKGATCSSFEVLGGGYAKDAFSVYYYGEKVEGAFASTFRYTSNGYAEDSLNTYYRGKKLR